MAKDLEIERKFIIPDEETLDRIRQEAGGNGIRGIRVEAASGPHVRYDCYFDTPERHLLAAGCLLRMSLGERDRATVTFKSPTKSVRARREIDEHLPPEEAFARMRGHASSTGVLAHARAITGDAPFAMCLRIPKLFWTFTGRNWETAYGYVISAGAHGAMERLDLEVEAKDDGRLQVVDRVSRTLKERFALREHDESKYLAGMREVG